MTYLFKCPACRHPHRLTEEQLGKKLKCMACNETFKVSRVKAVAEATPPPPAAKTAKRRWLQNAKETLTTAVREGSIPGAVSGVLAGVLSPLLGSIFFEQPFGESVGRAFGGIVVGVLTGTALGALLVAIGRRLVPDLVIKPGLVLLIGGAVIGGTVAVILEDVRWMPFGVCVGAAGAYFWGLLLNRVEAELKPPKPAGLDEDHLFREI